MALQVHLDIPTLENGKQYHVFFSYAHKDEQWVENTVNHLESRGFKCCFHARNFKLGQHILQNIHDCIESSQTSVLVLSPAFLKNLWCRYETTTAMEMAVQNKIKMMPVLLHPCTLPPELAKVTYGDVKSPYFMNQLEENLCASDTGSSENVNMNALSPWLPYNLWNEISCNKYSESHGSVLHYLKTDPGSLNVDLKIDFIPDKLNKIPLVSYTAALMELEYHPNVSDRTEYYNSTLSITVFLLMLTCLVLCHLSLSNPIEIAVIHCALMTTICPYFSSYLNNPCFYAEHRFTPTYILKHLNGKLTTKCKLVCVACLVLLMFTYVFLLISISIFERNLAISIGAWVFTIISACLTGNVTVVEWVSAIENTTTAYRKCNKILSKHNVLLCISEGGILEKHIKTRTSFLRMTTLYVYFVCCNIQSCKTKFADIMKNETWGVNLMDSDTANSKSLEHAEQILLGLSGEYLTKLLSSLCDLVPNEYRHTDSGRAMCLCQYAEMRVFGNAKIAKYTTKSLRERIKRNVYLAFDYVSCGDQGKTLKKED